MTRAAKKKNQLSAEDWIKAAFRALSAGGVQAIRAEAIARDLGTTKGSFYWHFRDVPALKEAMLQTWSKRATEDIIALNAGPFRDASARLQDLIALVTSERSAEYGGVRTEAAIREWAQLDGKAASTAKNVDRRRLEYLQSIVSDIGYDSEDAARMARLLYGALIGLEYLEAQELADAASVLEALGLMIASARM
ncbi:TetR/AcrR family transcriptional regulator [Hoeflea prorocentri]|uniref:TetR/AcrR family transcriptional regulator n=1 Tax=Hoeflea prorocentri TaxID=1922333 RepID=A0A9X3ULQ9_9HYPH|nr:TetR/AcrR family transcriptional regulator [Hoeflea prorocentri]MCY6383078.1 TetR/AcrR family transcriptional regulator [Hoeflea prorocentri]MDA5400878.1 TetR/AcrR family transcriptional regulator [Hoeflea prorocentri]